MTSQLVVVGTSLGGLNALKTLLSGLTKEFELPVAVVQHREPQSGPGLVQILQEHCPLPIREAEDKDEILSGRVYLAPPDYHLLVDGRRFALSTDAPVRHARPSIDVLFESAAEAYGTSAVGVILTGASEDGSLGLARIKERGGLTIAQEPATAECGVMPASAIAATSVDYVLPLSGIAPLLVEIGLSRSPAPAR